MIRIDAIWFPIEPMDKLAGTKTELARVHNHLERYLNNSDRLTT